MLEPPTPRLCLCDREPTIEERGEKHKRFRISCSGRNVEKPGRPSSKREGCRMTGVFYAATRTAAIIEWNAQFRAAPPPDPKDDVPRCKCGLAMPCNDCLPDHADGLARYSEPLPASAKIRLSADR
jgi:hypothetical protein